MSSALQRAHATESECVDFRAYRAGDEDEIASLLGLRFDGDLSVRHWRWKLTHWPTAAANVWVAFAGRDLIFHYGGIPLRFRVDDATVRSMISVDAMTAASYRRQGVLTRGVRSAFDNWKASGIAFTLGLPNEQWGSRTTVAGWRQLFPLRWMVRPLRLERIAARRLKMRWLNRAHVVSKLWRHLPRQRLYRDSAIRFRSVFGTDDSFDRLWEANAASAAFSTVRDAAWVEWRFLLSPARKYEVKLACDDSGPVGYFAGRLATTSDKTSAFLAEVVGIRNDRGVLESLLAEAISWAEHSDADFLAAIAVPGTDIYETFRRNGFFPGPAFTIHIVPLEGAGSLRRLADPRNWSLSGAEFDVV